MLSNDRLFRRLHQTGETTAGAEKRLQAARSSHSDEARNLIPKVGRGSFHVSQYKSFGAAMQRKTASFDKIPQAARDS